MDNQSESKSLKVPEKILRKIDEVVELRDERTLSDSIEELVPAIEALQGFEYNSFANYLVGYLWYLHPRRGKLCQIESASESALEKAIALDPSNGHAWLYLGHNAYDSGRYLVALKRFRQSLSQLHSRYLLTRAREMVVCCRIRLYGLTECLDDIDRFVWHASEAEVQDVWPQNLHNVLKVRVGDLTEFDKARLGKSLRRLDAAGEFGSWFSELL